MADKAAASLYGQTLNDLGSYFPMLNLFFSAFLTLFVVIDPPGCAPIYAGLVSGQSKSAQRATALRAALIAMIILVVFALFGEALLKALHISLDSFRIAGGLMLFLIALDMVFEGRTKRREERAEEVAADPDADDIAVFPMAMPMLAGPGAIASVMLLVAEAPGWSGTLAVLAALAAVMSFTALTLMAAVPLMNLLGTKVEAVLTRLLGVLVAAFATQFIVDGIKGAFGL